MSYLDGTSYPQAMYNEFSTANIQIDKDFSAKLSGYGCVGHIPDPEIPNNPVVSQLKLVMALSSSFLYMNQSYPSGLV